MTTSDTRISSQGFDLDALAASSAGDDDDVVYELGGGATVIPAITTTTTTTQHEDKDKDGDATATATDSTAAAAAAAEDYKQRGNEEFKAGQYLEACDWYTRAIERCPCPMKGDVILKLQDQHDKAQREKSYKRFHEQEKQPPPPKEEKEASSTKPSSSTSSKPSSSSSSSEHLPFVVPKLAYSESLAIYYCNRAASQWYLAHYDATIQDATVAILLNPTYAKALVRRSLAQESLDRIDAALLDMKQAQTLEPTNKTIVSNVKRLQVLEDKRLEVLKEETIGTFVG
jgi:tetratricopeptide (TPR) repeat protein